SAGAAAEPAASARQSRRRTQLTEHSDHVCAVCGNGKAWFGKDDLWYCRAHSDFTAAEISRNAKPQPQPTRAPPAGSIAREDALRDWHTNPGIKLSFENYWAAIQSGRLPAPRTAAE